jgi:transcriptional regulator with XRE-family HTH domain
LLFEEATLLHTLALAHHRNGNTAHAIALLLHVVKCIRFLSEDDQGRESGLSPILLSLSAIYIEEENYGEAKTICEEGIDVSIKRNKGWHTVDFVYNLAKCCLHLGDTLECQRLLRQAYFVYAAMQKKEQAEQVRNYANRIGVQINTYGVEGLEPEDFDPIIKHGESVSATDIGDFIAKLRKEEKLTQGELCSGLCSSKVLSKIELGTIRPNVHYVESFMQRMGRDMNKYFSLFLSREDFKSIQIRNEINALIIAFKYSEAEELLKALRGRPYYDEGAGLQFIKSAEATIQGHKDKWVSALYFEKLEEALKVTVHNYDEDKVARYRLTYNEVIIIDEMACYFCENKELKRGVQLFERLKESMDRFYMDEKEKMRIYPLVLYHYSKYLGHLGQRKKALAIAIEGEQLELKHERATLLGLLAINRAYNLHQLGRVEESVPRFAIAYYHATTFNDMDSREALTKFAKGHLNIIFD